MPALLIAILTAARRWGARRNRINGVLKLPPYSRRRRLLAAVTGKPQLQYDLLLRIAWPVMPRGIKRRFAPGVLSPRHAAIFLVYRRQKKRGRRLVSVADYAAEAREAKPLRAFWGFHNAGIFNRRTVKRRYQRHCEYYEILDLKWRLRWLAVGAVAISMGALIYFTTAEAAEFSIRPRYPLLEGAIALFIFGGFGGGIAEVQFWLHQWNMAYAQVKVFEYLTQAEMLVRSPDYWEGRLPMLGFADRLNFRLGGPAGDASVNNAQVFLIMKPGASPEMVPAMPMSEIFAMDALESDYDTVPTREAWSIFLKALEYGEVLKNLGRDRLKDLLEEGVPWIIIGGGMIIIFFLGAIVSEGS